MTTGYLLRPGLNECRGARIYLLDNYAFGDIEISEAVFRQNYGAVGQFRYLNDKNNTSGNSKARVFEYYVDNKLYSRLSTDEQKILVEYIIQAGVFAPTYFFSLNPKSAMDILLRKLDTNMTQMLGFKTVKKFIDNLDFAYINTYYANLPYFKRIYKYIKLGFDKVHVERLQRIQSLNSK